MARTVEMLGFMAPDLTVIAFPAWDCLPYDRASPHRDILARRIDALSRLSAMEEGTRTKLVVVTTVAAILQRVPTPAGFKGTLELKRGGRLDQGKLVDYLVGKGYARSGTVGEAGEFAVRGGIVDLFPPGTTMPIRVDFFGDEVEDLRLFDPLVAAQPRQGRRVRAAADQRAAADAGSDRAFPHQLPQRVRHLRRRRSALRGDQRRPAVPRHGALAAAVRDRAGAVRLLPAARHRHARPPGRRGGEGAAGDDPGLLPGPPRPAGGGARERRAGLSPAAGRPALYRRERLAGIHREARSRWRCIRSARRTRAAG